MDYREIDTLQEYVLVDQKRQQIECFRRNCEGQWVLYFYRGNREFELTSIDFTGSISQLYADGDFPADSMNLIFIPHNSILLAPMNFGNLTNRS